MLDLLSRLFFDWQLHIKNSVFIMLQPQTQTVAGIRYLLNSPRNWVWRDMGSSEKSVAVIMVGAPTGSSSFSSLPNCWFTLVCRFGSPPSLVCQFVGLHWFVWWGVVMFMRTIKSKRKNWSFMWKGRTPLNIMNYDVLSNGYRFFCLIML